MLKILWPKTSFAYDNDNLVEKTHTKHKTLLRAKKRTAKDEAIVG
jgi:hypothetical protein